jgi:hypothetical protein
MPGSKFQRWFKWVKKTGVFVCSERLYEIATRRKDDGQELTWLVAATNKKEALAAFKYLQADFEDLEVVGTKHTAAVIVSQGTAKRIGKEATLASLSS